MRRTDELRRDFKPTRRTSQITYGERQHLRAVLVSIQNFQHPDGRLARETQLLHQMIDARTAELDRIHHSWDANLCAARDPDLTGTELARLALSAPEEDYLLLRTIAEHRHTPADVLSRLAGHPYDAVRQNVARHPNASTETLERLASEPGSNLWLLVACNSAAPAEMRKKLRKRTEMATEMVAEARS